MGKLAGWTIKSVCAGGLLAGSLAAQAQGIPPNMQPNMPADVQPGSGPPPGYSGQWPPPRPAAPAQFTAVPATAPTMQPPVAAVASTSRTEAASPARRARVKVEGRLVTVSADNSSLSQILRELARQTGITITGGVTDERVYGSYGPAELPIVLATLLDGTGSNMLLSGDHVGAPQELILTPRQGGATPPSVMSGRDAPDPDDAPPQQTPRVSNESPAAAPVQPFVPTRPAPTALTPADPAPSTTTAQSPNGVKTPQEIYDQLMKMQQQTAKPPAPR